MKQAVLMMTDTRYFGLSKRQVSISTVGVVPRILALAQDLPVSAVVRRQRCCESSSRGCEAAAGAVRQQQGLCSQRPLCAHHLCTAEEYNC